MSFGENLRLMRKARNLTQEQFAEALGVSRQAVSKWEADSGYPETEKLIAISRVLGVSVDKLLDIEPENQEQKQTENEALSAERDQSGDAAGGTIAIMTFDKENMVRCQSVRSSQVVGNGKGPKYVLLGIKGFGLLGEKTEILGWYADQGTDTPRDRKHTPGHEPGRKNLSASILHEGGIQRGAGSAAYS